MRRIFSLWFPVVALVVSLSVPVSTSAQTTGDLQRQIDALQEQLEALKARQDAAEEAGSADPVTAPEAGKQVEIKWGPAPTFTSPDGKFSMKLRGRLLVDAGWVSDSDGFEDTRATEFRAARLGIEGRVWKSVGYKLEIDFAGNNATITDATISLKGPLDIKIGQFKLVPSLEEATSSRYITFMERASFTDAFGFGRQIGIGISKGGKTWSAQAAIFRGTVASSAKDEGVTLAGRLTYGPRVGDIQAHFGGSFRYRDAGRDQANFGYSQRPHNHLAAKYIDTSAIARSDTYWGLEAAAVAGSISFQAEYGWLGANLTNSTGSDPVFTGGYASLSWFITGETRTYKAGKGAFGRVKVARPVFDGGKGAWQVAARFDRIDLSDGTIRGGVQDSYILGVNWYLNDYARLMANYSHSKITDSFVGFLATSNGDDKIDTFGLRAQIDW